MNHELPVTTRENVVAFYSFVVLFFVDCLNHAQVKLRPGFRPIDLPFE